MEIRLFPLRRSPTRRGLLAVLRNHQLLRHLCTLYPSLVFLVVMMMMMMANLPVIQRSAEPPYSPAQLLERSSSRTVRMWKPRLTVVKFPPLPTMPIYPSLHLRLKRALRRRFSALALSLPYLYTQLLAGITQTPRHPNTYYSSSSVSNVFWFFLHTQTEVGIVQEDRTLRENRTEEEERREETQTTTKPAFVYILVTEQDFPVARAQRKGRFCRSV